MYAHLDNKLNAEVAALNSKIDASFQRFEEKIDARFDKVDARFDKVEEKLNELRDVVLEHNWRLEHIEGKLGIRHIPVGQEFESGAKNRQYGNAPTK